MLGSRLRVEVELKLIFLLELGVKAGCAKEFVEAIISLAFACTVAGVTPPRLVLASKTGWEIVSLEARLS